MTRTLFPSAMVCLIASAAGVGIRNFEQKPHKRKEAPEATLERLLDHDLPGTGQEHAGFRAFWPFVEKSTGQMPDDLEISRHQVEVALAALKRDYVVPDAFDVDELTDRLMTGNPTLNQRDFIFRMQQLQKRRLKESVELARIPAAEPKGMWEFAAADEDFAMKGWRTEDVKAAKAKEAAAAKAEADEAKEMQEFEEERARNSMMPKPRGKEVVSEDSKPARDIFVSEDSKPARDIFVSEDSKPARDIFVSEESEEDEERQQAEEEKARNSVTPKPRGKKVVKAVVNEAKARNSVTPKPLGKTVVKAVVNEAKARKSMTPKPLGKTVVEAVVNEGSY